MTLLKWIHAPPTYDSAKSIHPHRFAVRLLRCCCKDALVLSGSGGKKCKRLSRPVVPRGEQKAHDECVEVVAPLDHRPVPAAAKNMEVRVWQKFEISASWFPAALPCP